MRKLGLIALLLVAPAAARADALRHAALAALLIRQNPSDAGRRTALDASFDAALIRGAQAETVPGAINSRRRNWFPKLAALEGEHARLQIPELPSLPVPSSMAQRAGTALRAALAPWRALADAAWGGAWTGMVSVGLTEDAHR